MKQNQSPAVQISMADSWNSLTVVWTPSMGLSYFSGSTLCGLHRLPPTLLLALHRGCGILRVHPMSPTSPKCWGLLLQMGCTFTNAVSWDCFKVPSLNSLHEPFDAGALIASETAPSPMASSGLSECQASATLRTLL